MKKFYWITGILGIILAAFLVWLVLDIHYLYHTGMLRPAAARMRRERLITPSVAQIQPWMTFRYINYVFRLPPNYLAQTLKISDAYYPNLVVGNNLESVRQAVTAYPLGGGQ